MLVTMPTENRKFPVQAIFDLIAVVGIVVTIILVFSERTPLTVATMLSLMFLVGDIGIWRSGAIFRYWWPNARKTKGLLGILALIAWIAFVCRFGRQNWPSGIHVEQEFAIAYQYFGQRLGKPEADGMKMLVNTSEQRLANATSIWAMNSIGYVLWDGTKRWEVSGQTTPPPRDQWLDDKWLREHFHPDGGGPPTGDLAYTWEQSPDYWKRMGMVQWRCGETPDVIYQDFEHGRIIGVLRGTLYNDTGIIFVLFDDYTWESAKVNSGMVPFASARACGCAYWEADKSAFVPVK